MKTIYPFSQMVDQLLEIEENWRKGNGSIFQTRAFHTASGRYRVLKRFNIETNTLHFIVDDTDQNSSMFCTDLSEWRQLPNSKLLPRLLPRSTFRRWRREAAERRK